MRTRIILLFMFVTAFAKAQTVGAWQLKESSDGIKIYTADISNSKIKGIKVECQFNATLSQVTAALMDIKNSEEWLYHTAGNQLIKQVSPGELYYYSLIEMPWPVSNRDFIAHLKVTQDPVSKVVTMDAPCIPDMIPVKPKIVRITNSKGKWVVTPAGPDHVKILYTLYADPGGDVPSWLTNLFITQGPSQSFKKFKAHIQKPAYKNAKLDYVVNQQ
ncbi:START domain-containing protein [Mucilaginibacter antarcticus]|uniref:START domain-containing protein n=1 Tax=Mucilaginibacter antarcticus TaxID=1855725 RepID=A0ABW5XLP6_9SPHI